MLGITFMIGLPLFGWWLIKMSRTFDRAVQIAQENQIDFGLFRFRGKTNTFFLLSDMRFVWWLLSRNYRGQNYPANLVATLDESRRYYLTLGVVTAGMFAIAFGYARLGH